MRSTHTHDCWWLVSRELVRSPSSEIRRLLDWLRRLILSEKMRLLQLLVHLMRLVVLELGFCIVLHLGRLDLIYLLVQVVVHLALIRCNRVFYSLIHIHLLVYVGVVVLVLLDLLLRETVVVYRSLKMFVRLRDILRFDWLLLL